MPELTIGERQLTVDPGNPSTGVCSIGSFLFANEDSFTDWDVQQILRLKVGARLVFGGGAAATTTVERTK